MDKKELSQLARGLRRELKGAGTQEAATHAQMLTLIARAMGHASYEAYATTLEDGEKPKADGVEHAGRGQATAAPAPQDVWRAAMTLASNICVQESDRLNGEDGSLDAVYMASDCARRIRDWLEPAEQLTALLAEAGVARGTTPASDDQGHHLRTLVKAARAIAGKYLIEVTQAEIDKLEDALDQFEPWLEDAEAASPPRKDTLPRGNPYQGPLRAAQDIEFSARVDALWLADGDAALAARLLRTDGEGLMRSFEHAMEADVAFCSRPADWQPEHSLSRDFGIKADIARLGYEVRVQHKYPGCAEVTGVVEGNEVISLNNHVGGRWSVAGMTALVGLDFTETRRSLACQEEALRRAYELQHSGY